MAVHDIVKILRHGLGMTQAQLAKRAGLVQSHIAEIEMGRVDLRFGTIRKIFHALCCETLLLPKFKKKPQAILAERARETARKKVARVSGSMALEKQLPGKSAIQELLRIEERRLKDKRSPEIWEE